MWGKTEQGGRAGPPQMKRPAGVRLSAFCLPAEWPLCGRREVTTDCAVRGFTTQPSLIPLQAPPSAPLSAELPWV